MSKTPFGQLYELAERRGYTIHGDGMNLWLKPKNNDSTKDYSFAVTDENIAQAITWLEAANAPQRKHAPADPKTLTQPPGYP